MAYKKTEWKARKGTNLNRFNKSQETPMSVVLDNTPSSVTEAGTPFSIANMNKIEEGIYDAHEQCTVLQQQVGARIPIAEKGAANGVAELDNTRKIPIERLPELITGNLKALSLRKKYSTTSNTVGIIIKTNIPADIAGFVMLRIFGNTYTTRLPIDTQIDFYNTDYNLINESTMTMLNKGIDFSFFSTFIDTDDTRTIYIPSQHRYVLKLVEVFWNDARTSFQDAIQENRVTNIIPTTIHITTGIEFITCPLAGVFNTGASILDRAVTRWVATENGDNFRRGNSRANSVKTITQALKNAGNVPSNLLLYINRTSIASDVPDAYDSSNLFHTQGQLVITSGFVWERITDQEGAVASAPSITSTIWRIVTETEDTLQYGCNWRGAHQDNVNYAVGDVVKFTGETANSQEMTYICLIAITDNNFNHTQRPTGTLNSNRYWTPIGRYNPVLPGHTTISNFNSLRIVTGSGTVSSSLNALDLIVLGNLTLSDNHKVLIESRIRCANFTADYVSSFYNSQSFQANFNQMHYCGYARFNTTNIIHAYITHTRSKRILYSGTTDVNTDNPTRNAVASNASEVLFNGTTRLNGNNLGSTTVLPADNTAHGFNCTNGGKIFLIGGTSNTNITVTISGFGGAALNAGFGGEIEFNCRTLTLNANAAGQNPNPPGKGLRIETNGKIIRGLNNLAINRNDGIIDEFLGNGESRDPRNGAIKNTWTNLNPLDLTLNESMSLITSNNADNPLNNSAVWYTYLTINSGQGRFRQIAMDIFTNDIYTRIVIEGFKNPWDKLVFQKDISNILTRIQELEAK